jgi:hypothetical protein
VITEHVHPSQEERFIILAGEARFTLDGEVRIAQGRRTKKFHDPVADLAADGRTPRGAPRADRQRLPPAPPACPESAVVRFRHDKRPGNSYAHPRSTRICRPDPERMETTYVGIRRM